MNSPELRNAIADLINPARRGFLKTAAAGAATAGLFRYGLEARDAQAFAYEPYPRDNDLTTVVTSCDHNCGSRHMLVAHKKGDVIVRLSTDDGRYQAGGAFGFETEEVPQLRACLRGRSYRARLYSQERLLYPMMRVGERGEGRFKRVSWDEALDHVARKMIELKQKYGPTAILDQAYAGTSYGVLHKSDQIGARWRASLACPAAAPTRGRCQLPGHHHQFALTFGTIEDGNEDDTFAHSKLVIMWGWNPAYTFHGGNTFYYMRLAKQRGCKFVVVDPQYTDSCAAYDAWWIPIRPNTDAAMLAGMAHYVFANNLHDQKFIDKFCQGMDAGTMPDWAKDKENFKDYILGKYDNTPKTPEWAETICGVPAADIRKLADMYARTKPAALKASWSPGRNAYGEQYNRMAAALQAMTGNIGILGGCAEGVGKGWHAESIAYPYDEYANVWWASIKSDRWAHCVLNYPNVKREEIGCWPRDDELDGKIPNIKAIFWHGSDWFNQLTNI
ncbi:MAG: molybdopterin-dependent oxidoreductase, partial [Rhodocyclaceae bacterium]|nr:molybdopterin-dependent oxidoreductase [Rhodocyclaceae bacterium]